MTEEPEKKEPINPMIVLLEDIEDRLKKVEKLLAKTDVKEAWELQIELERIKRILLDKTPSGKEKPSKYSQMIRDKFKSF